MKDAYKEFASIFRQECNIRGYMDSGIIFYSERWVGDQKPSYSIVRISYDGTTDSFEFEYDFFEGQDCQYIRSMTDTEILKMMEGEKDE